MKRRDESRIEIHFTALPSRRLARWPTAAAAIGWLGAVFGLAAAGLAGAQLPRPPAAAPCW